MSVVAYGGRKQTKTCGRVLVCQHKKLFFIVVKAGTGKIGETASLQTVPNYLLHKTPYVNIMKVKN